MAVATRIATKFNSYYAEKPGKASTREVRGDARLNANQSMTTVLTTMVTNAVSSPCSQNVPDTLFLDPVIDDRWLI